MKRKSNQLGQDERAFESIRPSKVPKLLRTGEFFQSLDTEDDAPIQIPIGVSKPGSGVKCSKELNQLLSCLRFWGVDSIPDGVIGKLIAATHFRLSQSVVNTFCDCFPILKSVYKLQNSQYTNVMQQTIKMNALDLVRFLHGKGKKFSSNACDLAARRGNKAILEIAHTSGVNVTDYTMLVATRSEDLETIKYLHDVECPCTANAVYEIVCSENVRNLKYALQQDFPCDKTSLLAATVTNVEILKLLHENGFTLRNVLYEAACAGALECMKYAHQQGQPWSADVVYGAAALHQEECVKYAIEHGCPYNEAELARIRRRVRT